MIELALEHYYGCFSHFKLDGSATMSSSTALSMPDPVELDVVRDLVCLEATEVQPLRACRPWSTLQIWSCCLWLSRIIGVVTATATACRVEQQ
ncbi:hypothetical protein ACJRO7_016927 [Eucalyptus globulus]|uniref:Uncharacterized protein n=1 Tax=Eucalyptus globulus TaxID=34317 RepID=A0ABD3KND5_EUCGL